jgi:prepilin-type N-terminal cleavage/methylation domain-containing protein
MKRQLKEQTGFSLLEVLVAMALFSLILSFFGALFYRLGTTNAVIGRIERSENVDVVRRYLQRSLEGIRAHSQLDTDGVRTMWFEGEKSRVTFVGVAAGDRETGGLYKTELWFDSDDRLLQWRRPLGWGRGTQTFPEVLLVGLASLKFSYFPCPHDAAGPAVHHWKRARQLPFLVSVELTFNAGDTREWREISAFIPAAACPLGM